MWPHSQAVCHLHVLWDCLKIKLLSCLCSVCVEWGYIVSFSVILKAENLLVLSDVEFLQGIIEYFTAIFGKTKQQEIKEPPLEERDQVAEDAPSPPKKEQEVTVATPKPFPKIKVEASIMNFRVAIIETVEMIDPQTPDLTETQKVHKQLHGDIH